MTTKATREADMAEVATIQHTHDPMVSMIERVALDPNADLDKLERMLAMKERLDATQAQSDFNAALAAAQSEMPAIAARHNNDQTRSKYAKLADIYEACKPIAAKHGFSFNVVPEAGGRDGFMNMRWTLRKGSHVESAVSEVPTDDKGMKGTANKTGTHAFGSTTSYARRYLFCAVFDVAIGDDDDGKAGGIEPVSSDQCETLRRRLEEVGLPEAKFHAAFGHRNPSQADLAEFPADRFDAAIRKINDYAAKKAAASKGQANV